MFTAVEREKEVLQRGRTKGLVRLKEGFKFWQIELKIQVRGVLIDDLVVIVCTRVLFEYVGMLKFNFSRV